MTFYVGHMSLMKGSDIFPPNIRSSLTQAQKRRTRDPLRRLSFLFQAPEPPVALSKVC